MLPINELENTVLKECTNVAKQTGDNGTEFCFDDIQVDGLTRGQIKGYLSQLVQKGYIEKLTDCYFDFVYIDANHDYIHAKEDINNWYNKVKIGGIFAGHDYLDGSYRRVTYGVKTAVDEFCSKVNAKPMITKERPCPSWYFIRR